MSFKLLTDTLSFSEFSNQRYLYGNFLPSFIGIFLLSFNLVGNIDINLDSIMVLLILLMLTLIFAFISNRLSRYLIYKTTRAEKLYEPDTENVYEFLYKTLSENDLVLARSKIEPILKKEFKKTFNENFYRPAINLEEEELRRHETSFLFSAWNLFWIFCNSFAFILFFREVPFDIVILGNKTTFNMYLVVNVFFVLMIFPLIIIFIRELTAMKNDLIATLPIPRFKKESPYEISYKDAMSDIKKDIDQETNSIIAGYRLEALKDEFIKFERKNFIYKVGEKRINSEWEKIKAELKVEIKTESDFEEIEHIKFNRALFDLRPGFSDILNNILTKFDNQELKGEYFNSSSPVKLPFFDDDNIHIRPFNIPGIILMGMDIIAVSYSEKSVWLVEFKSYYSNDFAKRIQTRIIPSSSIYRDDAKKLIKSDLIDLTYWIILVKGDFDDHILELTKNYKEDFRILLTDRSNLLEIMKELGTEDKIE